MAGKRRAQSDTKRRPRRRALSVPVRQQVLLEAGYRCSNPVCRHVLTLELHHIEWVKAGGGNSAENLLALCPNCHSLHTRGHIPESAIRAWKGLLVSLNNPHRGSADLLLVLDAEETRVSSVTDPATATPPFRFSGDSLPALAGLLTSGLIEISQRFSGSSWFGGGAPTFEIRLTASGRVLVEAWKSGDPAKIAAALAGAGAA
jgi:hypothetical protein